MECKHSGLPLDYVPDPASGFHTGFWLMQTVEKLLKHLEAPPRANQHVPRDFTELTVSPVPQFYGLYATPSISAPSRRVILYLRINFCVIGEEF